MRDFRTLKVWQRAHELALAVYQQTADFPRDELYGLTSQIRRSSASVPTNIAEGCGRDGDRELGRFLSIAMGSASELEYQLMLARDLRFLDTAGYERLADELVQVRRMLNTFLQRLKTQVPLPDS